MARIGKSQNPWHSCHPWLASAAPITPPCWQHRRCKIHQPTGEALGNEDALKTIQKPQRGATKRGTKAPRSAQKPRRRRRPLFHPVGVNDDGVAAC